MGAAAVVSNGPPSSIAGVACHKVWPASDVNSMKSTKPKDDIFSPDISSGIRLGLGPTTCGAPSFPSARLHTHAQMDSADRGITVAGVRPLQSLPLSARSFPQPAVPQLYPDNP